MSLWLVTVVRSMMDDIKNEIENMESLKEFLDSLPDELEDLYGHLLDSLPNPRQEYHSLDMMALATNRLAWPRTNSSGNIARTITA